MHAAVRLTLEKRSRVQASRISFVLCGVRDDVDVDAEGDFDFPVDDLDASSLRIEKQTVVAFPRGA